MLQEKCIVVLCKFWVDELRDPFLFSRDLFHTMMARQWLLSVKSLFLLFSEAQKYGLEVVDITEELASCCPWAVELECLLLKINVKEETTKHSKKRKKSSKENKSKKKKKSSKEDKSRKKDKKSSKKRKRDEC